MIAVVQRVDSASVRVGEQIVGKISGGLLALVAIVPADGSDDVTWMARKLITLRIFPSGDKHFDKDLTEIGGQLLLVSNFTAAAATRHGRRPSFDAAADPVTGRKRFDELVKATRALGVPVETGQFGADMKVELINDGPVTVVLDSSNPKSGQ